jgi:peptidyl-prolyl cis-trans isomerase C
VKVNGKELTAGDADEQVNAILAGVSSQLPPGQADSLRPQIREQVQEQFVMKTLLESETSKRGIEVTDTEIDALIEETQTRLPPGVTLEQVRNMRGLDEAGFREEVKLQAAVKKLVDAQVDTAGVTDEEVAAAYEQNKEQMQVPETVEARHILLKFDQGEDDAGKAAKRTAMEAIRKELAEGADFAELAGSKSDCPSKAQGGNLGTFARGQMVPPFEQAAFSQEVGTVGEIVETQFGYHVIEVTQKNEAQTRNLEDVKEALTEDVLNRKRGEAFQTTIEELKAAADISYPSAP